MSEYEALLGKKRLEKQEQHWFWDSWILLALSATCCFATSNLMIDHLAVKHGIDVGAGVIDPDYTGEIRIVLFNHDTKVPYVIRPGYRVAQLILEQAFIPSDVYDATSVYVERGDAGFGSTGV